MSGLSQSRFMYLFRERFGMAPKEYQTNLRIGNAKTLLITTRLPISEVGAMSGYSDPLYFSRVFKKHTGQSPKQYRQQHLQQPKTTFGQLAPCNTVRHPI